MLSEFECETCGTKFVAAFIEVRASFPMRHCVACGGEDLKYLLSSDADVKPEKTVKELAKELAGKIEKLEPQLSRLGPEKPTLKELVDELGHVEDWLAQRPRETGIGLTGRAGMQESRVIILSAIVKQLVALK